jgi:predicted Co/Zn/Cd cation transporter (cation efflux family)
VVLWSFVDGVTAILALGVAVLRRLQPHDQPTLLPALSSVGSHALKASSRVLSLITISSTVVAVLVAAGGADPRPAAAVALFALDGRLLLFWGRLRQSRRSVLPYDDRP